MENTSLAQAIMYLLREHAIAARSDDPNEMEWMLIHPDNWANPGQGWVFIADGLSTHEALQDYWDAIGREPNPETDALDFYAWARANRYIGG